MSTEKARESKNPMLDAMNKNDSAITISSSSFADDSSFLISDKSGHADVFEISSDASFDKSAITKSASNDDGTKVFKFPEKAESDIKRDYNVCGKRFECSTGARGIRNNVVETMPVRT